MPQTDLVVAGIVAAVVALAVGSLFDHGRRRYSLVGFAVAVTVVVNDEAPSVLVASVALALALGTPGVDLLPVPGSRPARGLLVVAGAGAVGLATWALPDSSATRLSAAAAVAMIGAAGVGWLAARVIGGDATWVALAGSAVAVYAAVPDTEEITMVATAAVTGAAWLVAERGVARVWATAGQRPQPSATDVAVLAGLIMWAAAAGSVGRPPALITGPGSVAAIAVIAAVLWRREMDWWSVRGFVLVGLHVAVAVIVARTAGLEPESGAAFAMATGVVAAGGVVVAAAAWISSRGVQRSLRSRS